MIIPYQKIKLTNHQAAATNRTDHTIIKITVINSINLVLIMGFPQIADSLF